MDVSFSFIITIIAEVLFLALVACFVRLLITRNRLRNYRDRLDKRNGQVAELRKSNDRLQQALGALKNKLASRAAPSARNETVEPTPIPPQPVPSQRSQPTTLAQQNNELIESYQQRIANLERFKELYFELEQHAEETASHQGYDEKQIASLEGTIDTQGQLVDDLKVNLDKVTNAYEVEQALTDELEATVQHLETGIHKLQHELDQAKRENLLVKTDIEALDRYKRRAQDLEANETQLKRKLIDYHRRVKELETKQTKADYGKVQIREITDLSTKLQERDDQIRHLRQECETVGLQYEELAMKSLSLASEGSELNEEQKAQLEELKQLLEKNSAELARKSAEYEMLENCYLELQESTELGGLSDQMQQAREEKDALQRDRKGIGERIENACGPEVGAELTALRQSYEEKKQSLQRVRKDYEEIKFQFLEIAHEQIELRERNHQLEQECQQLKSEIKQLRESGGDTSETTVNAEELNKLRREYAKMEERYLALLEKARES